MTLKVQILQTLRRLFIVLVGLKMTWFSEKMLIFNICRRGLMRNLIKKSWTVSTFDGLSLIWFSWSLFSADSSVVVNPWEQFGTIPESLLDSRPGSAFTFWGFVVSSSSITLLTFSRLLSLLSILSSLAACSLVSWLSGSSSVLHSSTSWKKVQYDFTVHFTF